MRGRIQVTIVFCALAALAGGATSLSLRSDVIRSGMSNEPGSGGAVPRSVQAPRRQGEYSRAAIPVGGVLGTTELGRFAADELAELARTEPRAAVQAAQAVPRHWHRVDAIERVVLVWAEQSPLDALAAVGRMPELDPPARSVLRSRLLEDWVAADAEAALGYLLSRDGRSLFVFDPESARRVAAQIALRQPYAMIAAADPLARGIVRTELRRAAIARLVELDLDFALQRTRVEAPGTDRAQWARAVGAAYARQDPAAALAWARQFEPQLPGTLQRVVTLVGELYPERAVELGLCELDARSHPACRE